MNLTTRVPSIFYAIALLAFGVQQFMFGDFIAGRPPAWPSWLPGQYAFAYITGALLIGTATAVIIQWKPTKPLLVVGALILCWAGLQNILGMIFQLDYGMLLTKTGKALSLGSGAFLVASIYATRENDSDRWTHNLASTCQYCIGFFLLASGVQHFIFADFVKTLVPSWVPGSLFWAYFAGVALAAAGLALLTNIKAQLAATLAGGMIFTWVFVLHLPRAITISNQNEWTAVFEALAFSGILLLLRRC